MDAALVTEELQSRKERGDLVQGYDRYWQVANTQVHIVTFYTEHIASL